MLNKKTAKTAGTKVKKRSVSVADDMILVEYRPKGVQASDVAKNPKLVAEREFAGKVFNYGDVHAVPARYKGAMDEDMDEIGFRLKKSFVSNIKKTAAKEKEAEEKIVPEPKPSISPVAPSTEVVKKEKEK